MTAKSKSKTGGSAANDYPNIIEEPIRVVGDRTRQTGKSKKQSGKGSRKTGKKKAGKK